MPAKGCKSSLAVSLVLMNTRVSLCSATCSRCSPAGHSPKRQDCFLLCACITHQMRHCPGTGARLGVCKQFREGSHRGFHKARSLHCLPQPPQARLPSLLSRAWKSHAYQRHEGQITHTSNLTILLFPKAMKEYRVDVAFLFWWKKK